jgi:hypothetical protein
MWAASATKNPEVITVLIKALGANEPTGAPQRGAFLPVFGLCSAIDATPRRPIILVKSPAALRWSVRQLVLHQIANIEKSNGGSS